MASMKEESWKPLAITTETVGVLTDLFRDHKDQYGLDSVTKVMTTGIGAYTALFWRVPGIDYSNANLDGAVDLLKEPHKVTPEMVRVYSG